MINTAPIPNKMPRIRPKSTPELPLFPPLALSCMLGFAVVSRLKGVECTVLPENGLSKQEKQGTIRHKISKGANFSSAQ